MPFVGAAVGIVIAALAVVADALAYGLTSYIAHPVSKAIVVIFLAGTCYLIGRFNRNVTIKARQEQLLPPHDLGMNSELSNTSTNIPKRKAQTKSE